MSDTVKRAGSAVAYLFTVVAVIAYVVMTWHGFADHPEEANRWGVYHIVSSYFLYATVGALLLWKRPGNRVGLILFLIGSVPVVGQVADEYRAAHSAEIGHEFLASLAAWWSNWYFFTSITATLVIFHVFPTGRSIGRRWRVLTAVSVFAAVGMTVRSMFGPDDTPRDGNSNPWSIDALDGVWGLVEVIFLPALLASLFGGVIATVVRFRRSRGVERAQMKWFAFATISAATLVLLQGPLSRWSNVLFAVGFVLPPIAIGVAVLRYRLYDIDRVISRTVSYVVISAAIALPYLVIVTGITQVASSDLAVALATLVGAAMFQPLRRRVQDRVDRRFNRSRYDAVRTVEAFRSRLRDEVALESLERDLLAVVNGAVQPSRASLWLRSA